MANMTTEERQKVLAKVKPVGRWQPKPERPAFGNPTMPWEEQIGDLAEWRAHEGQGRKILPLASTEKDSPKTVSVCNSIKNRLNKLFPGESWTAYAGADGVYLRFNGQKRVVQRRNRDKTATGREAESREGDALFAETG